MTLGEQRELAMLEPAEVREQRAAAVTARIDEIRQQQIARSELTEARRGLVIALDRRIRIYGS